MVGGVVRNFWSRHRMTLGIVFNDNTSFSIGDQAIGAQLKSTSHLLLLGCWLPKEKEILNLFIINTLVHLSIKVSVSQAEMVIYLFYNDTSSFIPKTEGDKIWPNAHTGDQGRVYPPLK